MNIPIEYLLTGVAVLLLISTVASKASDKLGIPSLLLFILVGMLAGSEGIGGIYFDNPWLAQSMGVVALTFILFAGGLDTDWKSVRPVVREGFLLSTVGVIFTALLVGLFVTAVLRFSLLEGLLLGAIVSSTDAAAVFAVLRSKNVSLKGQLKPLLELESGSNDPMAVFLTTGLIQLLLNPASPVSSLIPAFLLQMALGATMGIALGKGMAFFLNRVRLGYDGLYPVATLALALLTYGATACLGGNGFLAVYIAGLVMGNSSFTHKKSLVRFHDGLAWLMQIAMFLTLGLLVFPSRLPAVMGAGLLVAGFLMFVARPVSVFLTIPFSKLEIREKAMVSWVGLRGAVPIILATFPLLAGLPKAEMIFNLVFFIVLTSALLQGTSIPAVAKRLKVDTPLENRPRFPIELEETQGVNAELVEFIIPFNSKIAGKRIVDLGLPHDSLITLVCRNDNFIVPGGSTVLEEGDVLLTLVNKENRQQISAILSKQKGQV
ncbi:MAG: potassium/proton antiporter [Candidatus Omnitrophica bacterium]|nr:potassium/proton antiporter [Candidatus Omnitrophota bacterium]